MRSNVILFFLSITLPFILTAQTFQYEEDILPKFMTEVEILQSKTQIFSGERGLPADGVLRGSCEDNCGGQSLGGCWCDSDCVAEGDCCPDFEEFCFEEPDYLSMPDNMWVPAEFEEVQSVLIRWPASNNASYRRLYTALADAIQQEAEVWIIFSGDTNVVHDMMTTEGLTLYNHRFLDIPSNSIWIRDYGPWGYYFGEDDSLAFIDMQYYPGRPLDNEIPQEVADMMGIQNHTMNLYQEGGNLMVDGFGHAYFSKGAYERNGSWDEEVVDHYKMQTFDFHSVVPAQRLQCDGGTGHIDMYAKLLDERTILVTEYPEAVNASDKQTIENNVDNHFYPAISTYGDPMRIVRSPVPHRDNGSLSTSCLQINWDARGYVNGVFVNRSFIMPIYSNDNSGDAEQDAKAIEYYESIMPGYNIVPIDARLLTPMGGAIHCITMQIPADNPIRFWHPPIEGLQSAEAFYQFNARITNRSGMEKTKVMWRIQGESDWRELDLVEKLDRSGEIGNLRLANLMNQGFTTQDTIEYFLYAKSNNQKEMTKPIVAPDGFYRFWFEEDFMLTSVGRDYSLNDLLSLNLFPNPATNQIHFVMDYTGNKQLQIAVTDVMGKEIYNKELGNSSYYKSTLDISEWASGVYFVNVSDGKSHYVSRFVKQ